MFEQQPQVMILGVYHMANNNRDLIQPDYDDHRSEQRLAEIDDILGRLATYNPTHIAIEVNVEKQQDIDTAYARYLRDEFELSSNELHLLGFQLARRQQHERIYCVDHNHAPPSLTIGFGGVLEFGASNGQDYLMKHINRYIEYGAGQLRSLSVREHLLKLNDPLFAHKGHQLYIAAAGIGNRPDQHYGAEWVGMYWYTRNLKIFANITHLAHSKPEPRVLMIIGAAHVKLLTEFIDDAPHLERIPVQDYLG